MNEPLVSIIMPTYNRSGLIYESLNSIKNQSYENYEAIIIDNNSIDHLKTKEIVESFGQKFKYYFLEQNYGPAKARNIGFKKSNGKYITFLDSDDLFTKDKLKNQVSILENNKDFVMVYSDEYILDYEGKISEKPLRYNRKEKLPSGYIAKDFFQESFIGIMSVMLRREIFEEMNGFDENLLWNEDDDLWFRIMLKYKVYFSEYVSGIRRLHYDNKNSSGNMSNNRDNMVYYQMVCLKKYLENEKEFVINNKEIFLKRLNNIFFSYIRPKKFFFRIPKLKNIMLYYYTKNLLKTLTFQ